MKATSLMVVFKSASLFISLVFSQSVFAEDLVEMYHLALENDPTYLGELHKNNAAKYRTKEAVSRLKPQLSAQYSYGNVKSETESVINVGDPAGENKYKNKEASLNLTQTIFNWSIFKAYSQAKSAQAQADAELEGVQQDLLLRISERYLEALAAYDAIGFAQAEKAAVAKQLELVQAMMKSGSARKTELFDAKARFARVEADEISAELDYDDKVEALQELVGGFSGKLSPLKSVFNLSAPSPEKPSEWMQLAVQQNPKVIAKKAAVEVSRKQLSVDRSARLPTVDLTARYSDATSELDNEPEEENPLISFGAPGDSEEESKSIYLNVTWSLYQGGAITARSKRAREFFKKAQYDLTQTQRAAQRAARAAYHGVKSAISKSKALSESLASQQLALEAKQKGFRAGLHTGLDVLDAERDVYSAKKDYARARYDYILNYLRLKHAVGSLGEQDLVLVNTWLNSDS